MHYLRMAKNIVLSVLPSQGHLIPHPWMQGQGHCLFFLLSVQLVLEKTPHPVSQTQPALESNGF